MGSSPSASTNYAMRRNSHKNVDPVKYLKIRIEQITQERTKNTDPNTHMILDKSIAELSIVLDLLERKAPL